MTPPASQPKRPYLRKRFFVRRHRHWGAAVCWYQWIPWKQAWGINWGIGCKSMREAKTIRKFLNSKVARFPGDFGTPFEGVVRVVQARRITTDQPPVVV